MTGVPQSRGPGARALALADRILQRVEWVTVAVAGIVIFIVMWIGMAEIVLRKVFNSPLYGQLDLIEQTMVLYTILPISYCWRLAGHIRVDLVIDFFHGRARWVVELLTTVAAFALIAALLPGILHFFENAWEIGDSTMNTRWPTWPSKAVPVFAFSVLFVRLGLEVLGYLRLVIDPLAERIAIPKHPDPVKEVLEEVGVSDPPSRT